MFAKQIAPLQYFDLRTKTTTVHTFLPKEKCEQKHGMAEKNSDDVSDTLVDPSFVSVIGVDTTEKKVLKSSETAGSRENRRRSIQHL